MYVPRSSAVRCMHRNISILYSNYYYNLVVSHSCFLVCRFSLIVLCVCVRISVIYEYVCAQPLSLSSSSSWQRFFLDKEILEEVDKDVKRTLPHLHFFNHDKKYVDHFILQIITNSNNKLVEQQHIPTHYDAIIVVVVAAIHYLCIQMCGVNLLLVKVPLSIMRL